MFDRLKKINQRPGPFEFQNPKELWTDPHISEQMLAAHLDENLDVASRKRAFIDRSSAWVVSRFGVTEGTRIVDFGCGPGLYAQRLARYGATVTGIDFSRHSLDYAEAAAQNEGLDIRYVHQDYLGFETGERFDLILLIMCDYCALSPAKRKALLGKFRSLLAPGGSVLLDVNSLAAYDRREEAATYGRRLMGGFWSPNDYYGFLNTFKYERECLVLDKYTIVEPDRTRIFYVWQQCFSPDTLRAELESCGLILDEVLGDVAGSPYDPVSGEFAVVFGIR